MCEVWLAKYESQECIPPARPPVADPDPAPPPAPESGFVNKFLSYTRLHLYDECPREFHDQYVARDREDRRPSPQMEFGKIVHEVLELVMREHSNEERSGRLSLDLAMDFYQQAWKASWLVGEDLYQEGVRQIRNAIADHGTISHWDILGIEQEFWLDIGRFKLKGFIDLALRRGDDVEVIDYKTGALPMPWESESSLQLSLYDIAARRLWPWAENVKLALYQTRQGVKLYSERTDEQRRSALEYVQIIGERTESDNTWAPSVGDHCPYCTQRHRCDEYQAVLKLPPVEANGASLDEIAKEHLELTKARSIISGRLRETEKLLRAALKNEEQVAAGGVKWRMFPSESYTYPTKETLKAIRAAGVDPYRVAVIDNAKLSKELKALGPQGDLLKLELETIAKGKIYPRLWSSKR
jgi:CRISPR/Cas system-associated exonuclease Cas4 (RecB family)